ncbi:MAG: shikimate dehydrogenase [Ideonella sp.]|nr:shikimate dehydrogenase [Ideonella sp.]
MGHPVAHSRSPFIHAAFARQTGEAIAYGRLECPPDGFEDRARAFAASHEAGMGRARGCNVTLPFKARALALATKASERAALAGAANTLRFDDDGWFADNTDGVGLLRDIVDHAGFAPAGARILLVGAGGAAAGVLGPLLGAAPREIVVANRTPEKAAALVRQHRASAGGGVLRACGLADCGSGFELVVNASASSVNGVAAPVPATALAPGALAIDLMYGPAAAPFLAWAAAHGARGRDGLGMLVEQAAEAFWLWRGVRPQTAPVLAALRAQMAREASQTAR